MILEFVLLAGSALAFVCDQGATRDQKRDYGHINDTWYKLTRSWWQGAFQPDSAATAIAGMIDSDRNCELWKYKKYDHGNWFESESLGVRIRERSFDRTLLHIRKKDSDESINVPLSDYDDYIIRNAISEFNKRRKSIQKLKEQDEVGELINERITRNYIDTIEMVEKRILHMESAPESDLLKSLMNPPPPEPKNEDSPVHQEFKKRVDECVKRRKNPPKNDYVGSAHLF